jgi:hypothetical protein
MNEIGERNPRFLIWVSELYKNFCRSAWSRTIPAVGKAQKHADKFSALCWGGIRPRDRVIPESGIPEFYSGRIKEVAILLVAALLLNGCGNSTSTVTTPADIWSADVLGGVGPASGFSFSTDFTLNSDGSLTFSSFQFYTAGACFPVNGEAVTGSIMNLEVNQNTYAVTGTLTFTVQSGSNTLTLTGPLTGTGGPSGSDVLTGGSVTGTWTFTGSGAPAGCNNVNGSFTMTQS